MNTPDEQPATADPATFPKAEQSQSINLDQLASDTAKTFYEKSEAPHKAIKEYAFELGFYKGFRAAFACPSSPSAGTEQKEREPKKGYTLDESVAALRKHIAHGKISGQESGRIAAPTDGKTTPTTSMVRWLQNMVSLNEKLANKATDSRDERNFRNYASAYASALNHALKLEPVDLVPSGDNQQPVKVTRICYCCSSCGLVATYEEQPCPLCAARLQLAEATRERDDARQVIGDLNLGPPGWRRAPEVDSALKEAAERSAEQYSQRGNLEKK